MAFICTKGICAKDAPRVGYTCVRKYKLEVYHDPTRARLRKVENKEIDCQFTVQTKFSLDITGHVVIKIIATL